MTDAEHFHHHVAQTQHPAALEPDVLAKQCRIRMTRRSGPGGQNRNKLETAVILTHLPTGLSGQASERRSQAQNRAVALKRLRIELAIAIRCPIELSSARTYAPSSLWLARCRRGQIVVNPRHDAFPALLAEALDVLAACACDHKFAAQALGCSPSQLIKFVKETPRALAWINEERRLNGRQPLM